MDRHSSHVLQKLIRRVPKMLLDNDESNYDGKNEEVQNDPVPSIRVPVFSIDFGLTFFRRI